MARPFRRTARGIEGWLHDGEAELLRDFGARMLELLDADDRSDPAVQRLFPPAYPDDAAAAEEFRGLVEDDLRETKRQSARVLVGLDPATNGFVLDDDAAEQWLLALNDLRLALGTWLDITDDEDYPEDEPAYELYGFLTSLQASLVDVLAGA